jgi:hypothetical protein
MNMDEIKKVFEKYTFPETPGDLSHGRKITFLQFQKAINELIPFEIVCKSCGKTDGRHDKDCEFVE